MKKSKKSIIVLIISVFLIIMVVAYTSYAFFANTNYDNNLNLTINLPAGYTANFYVTGGEDVQLNVNGADMLEGNKGSVANSITFNLNTNLVSTDSISCSYILEWVWADDSASYTKSTGATKEFTISGTSSASQSMGEKQLNTTTTTLGTYSICVDDGTYVTNNWTFTARFYNVNANQDALIGSNFKGKVQINEDPIVCEVVESCS